jgi:hypothetical protein
LLFSIFFGNILLLFQFAEELVAVAGIKLDVVVAQLAPGFLDFGINFS